MAVAPSALKRLLRQPLLERVDLGGARVDWDAGIIYGAKILGPRSENDGGKRFYPRSTLERAVPLYEGKPLKRNHPKDPKELRDPDDTIGWLENVELREDGLYGDLHLFTTKPFSLTLMEAAEKNPAAFSLSHNADGDKDFRPDGAVVISDITEVRSVDVVDRGATNRTLFESHQPRRTMKLSALLDLVSRSDKISRKQRKAILEAPEDMPGMDTEVPEPMEGKEPEEHLDDGFKGAVSACVEKYFAGEESAEECLKKIKELIGGHKKLTGGGEEEPVEEAEEEEEFKMGEPKKDKKVDTSEGATVTRRGYVLTEADASDLCDLAGIKPDKALLESLTGIEDHRARKILRATKSALLEAKKDTRPRSGSLGYRPQAPAKPEANNTKEFVDELRSGSLN